LGIKNQKGEKVVMLKRTVISVIVITVAIFWTVAVWSGDTDKININTASIEELVKLKRVGPKYAARIIEYRENNGPFEKSEDIIKVKGIGPKTWELNKDRIVTE
jgi:competence protein ComEA